MLATAPASDPVVSPPCNPPSSTLPTPSTLPTASTIFSRVAASGTWPDRWTVSPSTFIASPFVGRPSRFSSFSSASGVGAE
jgi:hypothetical protein